MLKEGWVLQLRQLLFEHRIVGIWLGSERLSMAVMLQRWRWAMANSHRAIELLESQLKLERVRWMDELGRQRDQSLKRGERDALRIRQAEDRTEAAEALATQLQAENVLLQQKLMAAERQHKATAELHRHEATARAVSSARSTRQEAVLRAQLDTEQLRLQDAMVQLASLEQAADEAEARLLSRHARDLQKSQDVCTAAAAGFQVARSASVGWRLVRAYMRLLSVQRRHAEQLHVLESERRELDMLRDGRGALEWRVKETRAKLIILGTQPDIPDGS
mmetsp:Transcript_67651/g.151002  ORF Transcript_67651/g.151002 Transcript_67651/m.151002 type:complete len:277 (-) Transcript_67651:319-1149(-)